MRGLTESMGTMQQTVFDAERAEFCEVAVPHPFVAQTAATDVDAEQPPRLATPAPAAVGQPAPEGRPATVAMVQRRTVPAALAAALPPQTDGWSSAG